MGQLESLSLEMGEGRIFVLENKLADILSALPGLKAFRFDRWSNDNVYALKTIAGPLRGKDAVGSDLNQRFSSMEEIVMTVNASIRSGDLWPDRLRDALVYLQSCRRVHLGTALDSLKVYFDVPRARFEDLEDLDDEMFIFAEEYDVQRLRVGIWAYEDDDGKWCEKWPINGWIGWGWAMSDLR
jgi:hypothetical protein